MSTTSIPVRKISRQKFINMLASIRGAKMCTIISETDPRMKKTGNPFVGQILKRTRLNVTINFIYQNSVNRVRTKEGNTADFEAKPRKWGQKVPGTPFVMHNDQMYLEAKPNAAKPQVEFINNVSGEIVLKEALAQWLPTPSSQAEAQGVSEENEVIVRTYAINNITDWIVDGKHYKIIG